MEKKRNWMRWIALALLVGLITALPAAPAEAQEADITLVNLTGRHSDHYLKALELFEDMHPEAALAFRMEDDARVLATAVMSGAPGYDILSNDDSFAWISSPALFKSGAAVDLSALPQVQTHLEAYLDVLGPVSVDGHLYGAPLEMTMYVWEVNEALLNDMGADMPARDWRWTDFFELADQVRAFNQSSGEKVRLLRDSSGSPYLLTQCNQRFVDIMDGAAHFDQPEFVALLEQWKQAADDGLLEFGDAFRVMMPDDVLFQVHWVGYSGLEDILMEGDRSVVLPPRFDADTAYPVSMCALLINANSSQQELAADFISCILNPEAMGRNWFAPVLKQDWTGELPTLAEDGPLTADAYAYLTLNNGVADAYLDELSRDQWFTLYPQLMNGEITAAEFCSVCQQRASLMLGE